MKAISREVRVMSWLRVAQAAEYGGVIRDLMLQAYACYEQQVAEERAP
ncbi:MAG: hypothetical protein NTV05_15355 [Acidobacteria bacterium]|nr:hypothetical protein [Acidobacteriota bacterium]